jgi:archaellum component FlaG (FlaF/FlaG flagellin family)
MARKLNLDTSERLDITCKRGDSFSMQITLKDAAGTGLKLLENEYVFLMQVRDVKSQSKSSGTKGDLIISTPDSTAVKRSSDSDRLFQVKDIDDLGNVTIYSDARTMQTIMPGRYTYELQYKVGSGDNETQKTVLKGSFVVNEDISE